MVVTWSDDDSEEENEDMTANMVKALTVQVTEEIDSSDEEMNDEELADTYKLMFTNWKEMCVTCEKQKKLILDLTKENSDLKSMSMCEEHDRLIQILMVEKKKLEAENGELQEEVSLLEVKLESLNKSLRLLNSGTDALDDLLEASKQRKSKKGIGFDYSTVNEEGQKSDMKFVVPQDKSEIAKKNFVVS
jgi:arsenate reductase-like glutaredoxin family protein